MRLIIALGVLVSIIPATAAQAQSRLEIVGSSSVFPFAAAVGERFARSSGLPVPQVVPTGTGGGIDMFCAGLGRPHPDFVGTTRPMSEAERELCRANGVRNVTQIKIGYEALVLVKPKALERFNVTTEQLFAALARDVEVSGKIVSNPNATWRDVDPALPEAQIRVFGPPQSSEVHQGFVRLAMLPACAGFPEFAALEEEARFEVCSQIRRDGSFTATDDLGVLRALQGRGRNIGVVSFSLYAKYGDMVAALPVSGVRPSLETISSGEYELARPLYLYTKNQHYEAVEGFLRYIDEFTKEETLGPEGYLVEEGLAPLADDERRSQRADAIGLNPFW